MLLPNTIEDALAAVMEQAEADVKSAHAEICRLQGLDPATHDWPDWSPQANSRRWHTAIRERFLTDGAPLSRQDDASEPQRYEP